MIPDLFGRFRICLFVTILLFYLVGIQIVANLSQIRLEAEKMKSNNSFYEKIGCVQTFLFSWNRGGKQLIEKYLNPTTFRV